MDRRVLAVLLHEEVGGAVDVEVGDHVRDFGAVMFGSVCLRDRSTGILFTDTFGMSFGQLFWPVALPSDLSLQAA